MSNPVDALLQRLEQKYVPLFRWLQSEGINPDADLPPEAAALQAWPETVRKEFLANLQRFMSVASETANASRGCTLLYSPFGIEHLVAAHQDAVEAERRRAAAAGEPYPTDALPGEVVSAPQLAPLLAPCSGDLLQRLESVMIHWTRQIKALVSTQDVGTDAGSSIPTPAQLDADTAKATGAAGVATKIYPRPTPIIGPLNEIAFWRKRASDLSDLAGQLASSPCIAVEAALIRAQSESYLGPFHALAERISSRSREAEDTLRHLQGLEHSCRLLETATPDEAIELLPELAAATLVAVATAAYFAGNLARTTTLLHLVSASVMQVCVRHVRLDAIFDGDVIDAEDRLCACLRLAAAWAKISKAEFSNKPGLPYDHQAVFAQLDASVQRCTDLLDVCAGSRQFARPLVTERTFRARGIDVDALVARLTYASSGRRPTAADAFLPSFAGSRSGDIRRSLREVQASYRKLEAGLRDLPYHPLCVQASGWHDDFARFKWGVKDLEVLLDNVIKASFSSCPDLAAAAALLEAWSHLAVRPAVVRAVARRRRALLFDFASECSLLKEGFEAQRANPPVHLVGPDAPFAAGSATWALSLRTSLAASWHDVRPWLAPNEALSPLPLPDGSAEGDLAVAKVDSSTMPHWMAFYAAATNTPAPEDPRPLHEALTDASRIAALLAPNPSPQADDPLPTLTIEPEAAAAIQAYHSVHRTLTSFATSRLSRWVAALPSSADLSAALHCAVAASCPLDDEADAAALAVAEAADANPEEEPHTAPEPLGLRSAFPEIVAVHTQEALYFASLGMTLPQQARDLLLSSEHFSRLHALVRSACAEHNDVLSSLRTSEEVALFATQTDALRAATAPALNKLKWTAGAQVERWAESVRVRCRDLRALVSQFHSTLSEVSVVCRRLSLLSLVSVRPPGSAPDAVFDPQDFLAAQAVYRARVSTEVHLLHKRLVDAIFAAYAIFRGHAAAQKPWADFVARVDGELEIGIRSLAFRSLQAMAMAMLGSTEPPVDAVVKPNPDLRPILRVTVSLTEAPGVPGTLVLSPTVNELAEVVQSACEASLDCLRSVSRVSSALVEREAVARSSREEEIAVAAREGVPPPQSWANLPQLSFESVTSLVEALAEDSRLASTLEAARAGVLSVQPSVHSLLALWERFRHVWDSDKAAYVRRLDKTAPPLDALVRDIVRFGDLLSEIGSEDALPAVRCVLLDAAPLKQRLTEHCVDWRRALTKLLATSASRKLASANTFFRSRTEALANVPTTVDELATQIRVLRHARRDLPSVLDSFGDIRARLDALERFDTPVDFDASDLDLLDAAAAQFKHAVEEASSNLSSHETRFKQQTTRDTQSLAQSVTSFRQAFLDRGPFSAELTPEAAEAALAEVESELQSLLARQEGVHHAMSVFALEPPVFGDLTAVAQDIDVLRALWNLRREWTCKWDSWKSGRWEELDVEGMDVDARDFLKRVKRHRTGASWSVTADLLQRLDTFRAVMPLITDLKNPALRSRHWVQLGEEVGASFDPTTDPAFTLERVFVLHLDRHAEAVSALSSAASQELSIEQTLRGIQEHWQNATLEVMAYKSGGHYVLRGTDDLFQDLEDHALTLATVKSSRFVSAFRTEVEDWERIISSVSETIELLLQVQRAWLYLESIFVSSEDIRRQLPAEAATFDDVNAGWRVLMTRCAEVKLVLACTQEGNTPQRLARMHASLETIQRQLDAYLDTKRRAFPRLYFLDADSLLEILGQARNPTAVQPHMKKCFEGVNEVEFRIAPPAIRGGQPVVEAIGLISPEGEKVTLLRPVSCAGPVEVWLKQLEAAMRMTLKAMLKETLSQLKPGQSRRDRWIAANPAQCCIAAGQVAWTTEVTRGLAKAADAVAKLARSAVSGAKGETAAAAAAAAAAAGAGAGATTGGADDASTPLAAARLALRPARKRQMAVLEKLTTLIGAPLPSVMRSKVTAIITLEVHNRDVLDALARRGVDSVDGFDWLRQLRYFWSAEADDLVVRQTTTVHAYGHEYLGASKRLVVTPLTDRCYMTLTTAIHLRRGGSPMGPAGTGKTETVKDLAKALGYQNIVLNCSEGLDYVSLGRMYSGLAQCGAWLTADEFNRLKIEVLSVVAQQILSIFTALSEGRTHFVFMGQDIPIQSTTGVFITMNPGYAGRTELPDNLKALFRPVAMMVPDFALIAEITLLSQAIGDSRSLAKKVTTLYSLCSLQLSKAPHYDWGLRSQSQVLLSGGVLRRESGPEITDEQIIYRVLSTSNFPKLIARDVPLFSALLNDLFPSVEIPAANYGALEISLRNRLTALGYLPHPAMIKKIFQLHETKRARHGVMIIGDTQGGKTTMWRSLEFALTEQAGLERARWAAEHGPDAAPPTGGWAFEPVKIAKMNPKAQTLGELYGEYDLNTREWSDGLVSNYLRTASAEASSGAGGEHWIVFDGPVDTLWIESLNTVLDDSRILTLINGERISFPPAVSFLFEAQDLAQASPATVSRCGMIYVDPADLGTEPIVQAWLNAKRTGSSVGCVMAADGGAANHKLTPDPQFAEVAGELLEKQLAKLLEFYHAQHAAGQLLLVQDDVTIVKNTLRLLDLLATPEHGVASVSTRQAGGDQADAFARMVELWFAFAVVWTIGSQFSAEGRVEFDVFLRDLDGRFPSQDSVFDFQVDPVQRAWTSWTEAVPQRWAPPKNAQYHKLLVPTIDTVRQHFVISALTAAGVNTLLVGGTGTAKTALVKQLILPGFCSRNRSHASAELSFSARTTAAAARLMFESRLEKRTKDTWGPPGNRTLLAFIDDFSLPAPDEFGSQPPLELVRQWAIDGAWHDPAKIQIRNIAGLRLIAAMQPPGRGRNTVSGRLLSRFHSLGLVFPADAQIHRVYSLLLSHHLSDFDESVRGLAEPMTTALIEIYHLVADALLPTPAKPHYGFNMRDLSAVVLGICRSDRHEHDARDAMLQLWTHESLRVFSDRLVDQTDRQLFADLIDSKLGQHFSTSLKAVSRPVQLSPDQTVYLPPVFGDFIGFDALPEDATPVYKEYASRDAVKAHIEAKLEEYNIEPGHLPMDIVLFRDAVDHVCRIHRVLRQPSGHMLLVGVGGSGRRSLSRIAAYQTGMQVFQIELTRNYRIPDWREDMKKLYRLAGTEEKPTVFLLSDTQIANEAFLEDINNILSVGEIPSLFADDEIAQLKEEVRPHALAAGVDDTTADIFNYFRDRCRDLIHVVFCVSPVGAPFRRRLRMFPALASCTTINVFSEWPDNALREVALKFIADVPLSDEPEAAATAADGSGTPPPGQAGSTATTGRTSRAGAAGEAARAELAARAAASVRAALAQTFVAAHKAVTRVSDRMLRELGRPNYVTPTHYLELVTGYVSLLAAKRAELGAQLAKLEGGVGKLEETRTTVERLRIELEEKRVVVAAAQKECEELLVVIVQERGAAAEQAKAVAATSELLGKEEAELAVVAADAQQDLDKALPALERAMEALKALNKKDMSEIKAFTNPPPLVRKVMNAVMVLRRADPSWAEAKRQLGDPNFLQSLMLFDKDNVSDATLKRIAKFISDKEFDPEIVGRVSLAARSLCMWVHAITEYSSVFRVVAPKKAALQLATDSLAQKQGALGKARADLAVIQEKVEQLRLRYTGAVDKKEALRIESETLAAKLARADKLVVGLAGERVRWLASIEGLRKSISALPGDCVAAAAFLAYAGPFAGHLRNELVRVHWLGAIRKNGLPHSPDFTLANFLSQPTTVRDWRIKGLPNDTFSTENGVLVTQSSSRYPFCCDPQGQANRWIRALEDGNDMKVIDLSQPDFLRTLEIAVQFGVPVLIQDVGEEIDASLDPLLQKAVVRSGGREVIRIGDKDVDWNPSFRLYLTTRLPNPNYGPEISTKVAIVNFAVVEAGLRNQLLGEVVRRERPELEAQKDELVVSMASMRRRSAELEDEILGLLASSSGSLLDDVQLVDALETSKNTSQEIGRQLEVSVATERKIDKARAGYEPCAARAAQLFFVLSDLSRIAPMYQYALEAYIDLFNRSLTQSPASDSLQDRIAAINDYHTYAVYAFTCRGLFQRHTLLFAFLVCLKVMTAAARIDAAELAFFLRGGVVLDKASQPPNPTEWLSPDAWDNLTELERLPAFANLIPHFEGHLSDWRAYYTSAEPEREPLPGAWESQLDDLQRMLVVRALRPDRVTQAVSNFVASELGPRFVDPPPFDLAAAHADSSPTTPLVFVLSPGVDPTGIVSAYAATKGMSDKLAVVALGQGQAPIAERAVEAAVVNGSWVLLANCHLLVSWLPKLEKLIESLPARSPAPHSSFRLWLSSDPTPDFPIGVLQHAVKMTTEPPRGLRANMVRLYNRMDDAVLGACNGEGNAVVDPDAANPVSLPKEQIYKRLLFGLCFFHASLIERRKFLTLGWNVQYDFNDSDFDICARLLSMYLKLYNEVPWEALRYLTGAANYGGRVTDEWDRRILDAYMSTVYCPEAVTQANYRLVTEPSVGSRYVVPDASSLRQFREASGALPLIDEAEVYGQHPNASIASQAQESLGLLSTVLQLQPKATPGGAAAADDAEGADSGADAALEVLVAELAERVPKLIENLPAPPSESDEKGPLITVLLQEAERYNLMLAYVATDLENLARALKGLVAMSAALEATAAAVTTNTVPAAWAMQYSSSKPLAPWLRDLEARIAQLSDWANSGPPAHIWVGGLTFPTALFTALLQQAARKRNCAIDELGWSFTVTTAIDADRDITVAAPLGDGAYISGLFLEGAAWDVDRGYLVEPKPMELTCTMPVVHFKPVESRRALRQMKHSYECPCYYYPVRTGTRERPSFMLAVALKSGDQSSEHWIRRGAALLMSLAQ
jgi:dynein heavy chain